MRFASLGSGSRGNATLVEAGDTRVLIDCGFTLKETLKRLERLECEPKSLSAILVTHEHGDHIGGVDVLARRFSIPVYLTAGTYRKKPLREEVSVQFISDHENFALGELSITPVAVPHDAAEPVQFVLQSQSRKLGVLTDLGHVSPHVLDSFDGCDALVLEANHDSTMLAYGPYPPSTKQRVGSAWGHLNNHQTAGLLEQIQREPLQHLVLAHISLQNNHIDHVKEAVHEWVGALPSVHYACQDEGFDWLEIA